MIGQILKVRDKVRYLLKYYPKTRDSDTDLYIAYLVYFHDLGIKVNNIKALLAMADVMRKAPPAESMTRARRLIQSRGLYEGTRREARAKGEAETYEYFRQQKIEDYMDEEVDL